METEVPSFADLLKQYRAAAGLTQEELAERANLSARTISDLERGINHRPYSHTVQRLVQALGLEEGEVVRFQRSARRIKGAGDERGERVLVSPHSLPIQPTSFIGRRHEMEEVSTLLGQEDVRLLTLTGPAGVGKTRLALRVADEVAMRFPDGVVFVSLASLTDPELLPFTLASILTVTKRSGQPILESLSEHLREKSLLLVMDNFEHLLPAVVVLSRLLAACPRLSFLVTSRAILHLAAEHEYSVRPLSVPMPMHLMELDALPTYDAVQLFLHRARAVKPGFELTDENAAAIAQICCWLDGLPLSIELAAARIRLFPPHMLLARLVNRLQLLTGGPRDVPARQQTLRGAIDWSYCLLGSGEQRLFERLSVFMGGCSFEAAEAVADPEGTVDLLAGMTSLVEKSLLRQEGEQEPRFRMLETIREFALEKLAASNEAEAVRRRHAEYFLALAQSANLINEAEGAQRHDIVIRERNNVRGALDWALESGEIDLGLELAALLENYWATNSPHEGKRWLDELLERAPAAPGDLRALALRARGAASTIIGEFDEGTRYYEQSLAEYRGLGDERGIGIMHHRLAVEALRRGDAERAWALVEESLRLHRKIKFTKGEAQALSLLARLELVRGHEELAFELFERSAALCQESGFVWWRASVLLQLAELLLERGRMPESDGRAREALRLAAGIGDRQQMIFGLALLARAAGETGQIERAGCLWGAIETEEAGGPVGQWEAEREQYAQLVLTHVGPEFERGRQEGAQLSLREAVDEVLDMPALQLPR